MVVIKFNYFSIFLLEKNKGLAVTNVVTTPMLLKSLPYVMMCHLSTSNLYIYIYIYEIGSSYTWCNLIRVTHFFGSLICIRSKGEKNTHSHVFIVSQKLVTKSLILLIKNGKIKNSVNSLLSIIIFIFSPSLTWSCVLFFNHEAVFEVCTICFGVFHFSHWNDKEIPVKRNLRVKKILIVMYLLFPRNQ